MAIRVNSPTYAPDAQAAIQSAERHEVEDDGDHEDRQDDEAKPIR